MLDRFKVGYEQALEFIGLSDSADDARSHPVGDPDQDHDAHRAVLELLVATMFVDGTVTDDELDEIRRSGDDHGWTTSAFSFDQAMGTAIFRVRDAREQEPTLRGLVASASDRIVDPELRAAVVGACRQVAGADGTTDATESTWLTEVGAAFGQPVPRVGTIGRTA